MLQSCPTESQEFLVIPGKICAMDSVAFSSGMFNSAVGGHSIVAPLGSHTANGFLDLTLLEHVALTNRKWPVHPESIFAVSCGLRSWGGATFFNH
jgi:hypothetical protein